MTSKRLLSFAPLLTVVGWKQLLALLSGKTCVFTGHSGVGKSSLVNALLPGCNFALVRSS